MPWENTKAMTDEDLKAMFAYLRSIPAVKNQVPLPVIPAARLKRNHDRADIVSLRRIGDE